MINTDLQLEQKLFDLNEILSFLICKIIYHSKSTFGIVVSNVTPQILSLILIAI